MVVQSQKKKFSNFNLVSNFYIDIDVKQQKRARYSLWNLLSDAGGLHDGLCLLVWILINPFSANIFQKEIA